MKNQAEKQNTLQDYINKIEVLKTMFPIMLNYICNNAKRLINSKDYKSIYSVTEMYSLYCIINGLGIELYETLSYTLDFWRRNVENIERDGTDKEYDKSLRLFKEKNKIGDEFIPNLLALRPARNNIAHTSDTQVFIEIFEYEKDIQKLLECLHSSLMNLNKENKKHNEEKQEELNNFIYWKTESIIKLLHKVINARKNLVESDSLIDNKVKFYYEIIDQNSEKFKKKKKMKKLEEYAFEESKLAGLELDNLYGILEHIGNIRK